MTFLKTCGGLKFEGRTFWEVEGSVKFYLSAPRADDAKERTAVASANGFMVEGIEPHNPINYKPVRKDGRER